MLTDYKIKHITRHADGRVGIVCRVYEGDESDEGIRGQVNRRLARDTTRSPIGEQRVAS